MTLVTTATGMRSFVVMTADTALQVDNPHLPHIPARRAGGRDGKKFVRLSSHVLMALTGDILFGAAVRNELRRGGVPPDADLDECADLARRVYPALLDLYQFAPHGDRFSRTGGIILTGFTASGETGTRILDFDSALEPKGGNSSAVFASVGSKDADAAERPWFEDNAGQALHAAGAFRLLVEFNRRQAALTDMISLDVASAVMLAEPAGSPRYLERSLDSNDQAAIEAFCDEIKTVDAVSKLLDAPGAPVAPLPALRRGAGRH